MRTSIVELGKTMAGNRNIAKLGAGTQIFLLLTILSLCRCQDLSPTLSMYVDELPLIPTIFGYGASLEPGNLTIGMYQILWKFHRDLNATPVFAYGTSASAATVPGPCIEALQGVPTYITWENHLPQAHILPWDKTISVAKATNGGVPTVVHLHGGIHPPESDGSALAWFTSNFSEKGPAWTQPTYWYPNVQHAGNLWYHDHALGLTRVNLLAGLIAPYTIKNYALEAELNLPSGPEFDRHLMIFDRIFYTNGSIYMNSTGNNPSIHPQWQPEYFGDVIVVNGKAWPFLNVQRRKYRFRIINASNARYYRFNLTNGLTFTVVGHDGSYLASPVVTPTVILSPAEIADVVIDFSLTTANETLLQNDAPYPYPVGSAVNQLNSQIMKFIVQDGPPAAPDNSTIPTACTNYNTSGVTSIAATRYIALNEYTLNATGNPTHLLINGKFFTDPVTETPSAGTTEVWEVINLTGDNHPLHIHLAEFQAIKIQQLVNITEFKACMNISNDALACNVTAYATGLLMDVPAHEQTWKNVVKLEPDYMTTVVVKFNLVDDDDGYPFDVTSEPGYVYHCHILDHEDNEMIRPLKLVSDLY